MLRKFGTGLLAGALVMTAMPVPRLAARPDQDDHHLNRDRHVLLISIDGMHALDYANCVKAETCPTLAALGKHGVTYTRTSTSRSSDSFPGLMALVTGGTPKTVGAFYDIAWDRVLAPPAVTTGNGLVAGPCAPNEINGTQTEYEEGDEIDQTKLNGGGPYASVIDGGILSIEPSRLIRDPFSSPTPCMPVYPWNFIRDVIIPTRSRGSHPTRPISARSTEKPNSYFLGGKRFLSTDANCSARRPVLATDSSCR